MVLHCTRQEVATKDVHHVMAERTYIGRVFCLIADSVFVESECYQRKICVIMKGNISVPFLPLVGRGEISSFQVGTEIKCRCDDAVMSMIRGYDVVISDVDTHSIGPRQYCDN